MAQTKSLRKALHAPIGESERFERFSLAAAGMSNFSWLGEQQISQYAGQVATEDSTLTYLNLDDGAHNIMVGPSYATEYRHNSGGNSEILPSFNSAAAIVNTSQTHQCSDVPRQSPSMSADDTTNTHHGGSSSGVCDGGSGKSREFSIKVESF